MEAEKKISKTIEVRGNVVSASTGKGMTNVPILIVGFEDHEIKSKFKTQKFGLFNFELDNSQQYKLIIDCESHFCEKYMIPKGLKSVYISVLIKPKKK